MAANNATDPIADAIDKALANDVELMKAAQAEKKFKADGQDIEQDNMDLADMLQAIADIPPLLFADVDGKFVSPALMTDG